MFSKVLISAIAITFIAIICLIYPVQGFVVNHLDYSFDQEGNALVTANYTLSLGESVVLAVPTIKDEFKNTIKNEYGENSHILELNDKVAQFTIPNYAIKTDTYIQTPFLTFEKIKTRINSYWFLKYLDIKYTPDVTTITFYNGQVYTYKDAMTIPPITLNF
jgi:hypothetical protein